MSKKTVSSLRARTHLFPPLLDIATSMTLANTLSMTCFDPFGSSGSALKPIGKPFAPLKPFAAAAANEPISSALAENRARSAHLRL
jgi:hypothetical protein